MSDELYITPHEAALAVVATAMKKARLRLDTLAINSVLAGVLFSAGGMLALNAQAENPELMKSNPGIVHYMQGAVYPIGLFYVVIMGAELYNSNILYFTVGVCRGAVTIVDLLVSWSVSWILNLGGNLFVAYCICHWSGVTDEPLYIQGSIDLAESKFRATFIQTFVKACAGNFAVCLAVYMQLLCKPTHVKLIVMALPIFTFVAMGFTHTVADMFLIPMGMFNGADIPVGQFIWRSLIPATVGNAVGGAIFSIVVPFYLHLVVVERDRKLLKLPSYEVKDEQPELNFDSRVVRILSHPVDDEKQSADPVSYRPERATSEEKLRSPPGVFPVMGMGKPLTREKTIAGESDRDPYDMEPVTDNPSIYSRSQIEQEEEEEYVKQGGYNARENKVGETLRRVASRRRSRADDVENSSRRDSAISDNGLSLFKTLSRSISSRRPRSDSIRTISKDLHRFKITPAAAGASDSIAGIDNYDMHDFELARPQKSRRTSTQSVQSRPTTDHGLGPHNPRESDEDRSDEEVPSSGKTL